MTKTTPNFSVMTPDFTPMMRLMAIQTRFAMEATQGMIKLAMLPWAGMQSLKAFQPGLGSICAPGETAATKASVETVTVDAAPAAEPAVEAEVAVDTPVVEDAVVAETPTAKEAHAMDHAPASEAEAAVEPTPSAPVPAAAARAEVTAPSLADAPAPDMTAPEALDGPRDGQADDLTAIDGVGPRLAEKLNEHGIYHYDQIAGWSEANVAWVDDEIPGVRGRASRNGWVAQAAALAG